MPLEPQDYEDIRQLLARYALAIDLGDRAGFLDCFTEDGSFEARGLPGDSPNAGRHAGPAVVEIFEGTFGGCAGHARHWASMPRITGDGQQAQMTCYLMVVRAGTMPRTGILVTGLYHDELRKVGGRWLFRERVFTADPQPQHRVNEPSDVLVTAFDNALSPIRE